MSSADPRPRNLVARLRAAGCVYAEEEAELLSAQAEGERLAALVERRVAGEPLEHVLGWAAFDGLRVRVLPGVFVPRSSSRALVTAAADLIAALPGVPSSVVVDLCCGSGAVGAAVAARAPAAEVHAVDVDPVAVACARLNLPAERVHEGDLYAALPSTLRGRLDVLTCHAPHVPTREIALMPREARIHEPAASLDGGEDGLAVQRAVVAGAGAWLAPRGVLLLECSTWSADATSAVCEAAGLTVARVTRDPDLGSVVLSLRPDGGVGAGG